MITSLATNWIAAIGRLARAPSLVQTSWAWTDRWAAYQAYDAYYSNAIYETIANGGQREYINAALGNASAHDLDGLYNPVSKVVDLYLNVFGGRFGEQIPLILEDSAGPATAAALDQLWRWSNMDMIKQPLCRYPALHGVCGLRIVAENHPLPSRRRVYLKPEHPKVIRDVELDARGNVQAIQLEYDEETGLAEQKQVLRIRETQTKQGWKTETVDPATGQVTTRAQGDNPLGLIPYVLVPFEQDGTAWGRNAWHRSRAAIDRFNALTSHIDIQIHKHLKVTWLVAAEGSPPSEFDFSDMKVIYINKRGGASAEIEPLIAQLSLADATAQAQFQLSLIENDLPELKGAQGTFLSGQSGETVAQLRAPAEDRILLARSNMEDALVRAQKIALSWGVLLDLWDIGTGTGTAAAAQRAYEEGYESHRFQERPAFLSRDTPQAQPTQQQEPQAQAPKGAD